MKRGGARYLNDQQPIIPGDTMTFPGIKDAQQHADLLAFLTKATPPGRRARIDIADIDGRSLSAFALRTTRSGVAE